MTETKWTKGPWVKHKMPDGRWLIMIMPRDGRESINIAGTALQEAFGETDECCEANAHLIASAPELYEALENLWAVVEGEWDGDMPHYIHDVMHKSVAALAKARGET